MNDTRALVLGGGGVAGIAWQTGVITGLADEGVHITDADLVIGTSAGSTVAAQITGGAALDDLFARQFTPDGESGELAARLDIDAITAMFTHALRVAQNPTEIRIEIGRAALAAPTVDEAVRRTVIEHRLPTHTWPIDRDLRVIAVTADTGELHAFTSADDVSLVDAVAASCAVPGVWPPVTINGRRYIDGGVRTSTNADLAAGCDRILVLAPVADLAVIADTAALDTITRLASKSGYLAIAPDAASTEAIGPNSLALSTRAPTATAGRLQGRMIATEVARFWERTARTTAKHIPRRLYRG